MHLNNHIYCRFCISLIPSSTNHKNDHPVLFPTISHYTLKKHKLRRRQSYLESISFSPGNLVPGDATVNNIPCILIRILALINQTTPPINSTILFSSTTPYSIKSNTINNNNNFFYKKKKKPDHFHGNLNVAIIRQPLHVVQFRHQSIPERNRTNNINQPQRTHLFRFLKQKKKTKEGFFFF